MDRPRLKTAYVTRGHTKALKDGTVKPPTFDFEFEEVPQIIQAFRRMVRGLEFDISEMAITTYLCERAFGKAFTAVPVFPMRVPPRRHPAQYEGRHQRAEGPGGQARGREPRVYRDHGSLGG